ncbi:MAG: hypothetical protein L0219_21005, partial [Phycisphaerales bacterium]|nr:hypothetical protein [Phycisphaerales bacterium]
MITELGSDVGAQAEGVRIEAVGYWGALLGQRRWRKRWADNRITEEVWRYLESASGANKCTIDRHNRIRFIPKGVAWANGNGAAVRYTMPTGETIKRITFNYDLQEAAQAWKLELDDGTTVLWSVNASGTGSVDHTFATPPNLCQLVLRSEAAQTPVEDGTYYGQFTNIVVYGETGSINLTEIAKDVRARLTDLSANEGLIASNTLSLEPFLADRFEKTAAILASAASYGDSSFNQWAVGVRESDLSTDGKPILFAEQYPVLTDYDYAVRLDEDNIDSDLLFPRDFSQEALANWIIVEYTDLLGRRTYLSPDDNSALKDQTSIDTYYQADEVIQLGTVSAAVALNIGRRYLAAHKDP